MENTAALKSPCADMSDALAQYVEQYLVIRRKVMGCSGGSPLNLLKKRFEDTDDRLIQYMERFLQIRREAGKQTAEVAAVRTLPEHYLIHSPDSLVNEDLLPCDLDWLLQKAAQEDTSGRFQFDAPCIPADADVSELPLELETVATVASTPAASCTAGCDATVAAGVRSVERCSSAHKSSEEGSLVDLLSTTPGGTSTAVVLGADNGLSLGDTASAKLHEWCASLEHKVMELADAGSLLWAERNRQAAEVLELRSELATVAALAFDESACPTVSSGPTVGPKGVCTTAEVDIPSERFGPSGEASTSIVTDAPVRLDGSVPSTMVPQSGSQSPTMSTSTISFAELGDATGLMEGPSMPASPAVSVRLVGKAEGVASAISDRCPSFAVCGAVLPEAMPEMGCPDFMALPPSVHTSFDDILQTTAQSRFQDYTPYAAEPLSPLPVSAPSLFAADSAVEVEGSLPTGESLTCFAEPPARCMISGPGTATSPVQLRSTRESPTGAACHGNILPQTTRDFCLSGSDSPGRSAKPESNDVSPAHHVPVTRVKWICEGCRCEIDSSVDVSPLTNYNICEKCRLQASEVRSSSLKCPNGHALEPHAESLAWICDGCQKDGSLAASTGRHRCTQCDYDLCEKCCLQASEVRSSSLKCPNGHALEPHHAESLAWICDCCQKDGALAASTGRHRCMQCDYDLCGICHARHGIASEFGRGGVASTTYVSATVTSSAGLVECGVSIPPHHGSSLHQAPAHSMFLHESIPECAGYALSAPKTDTVADYLTFSTMGVSLAGHTSAAATAHYSNICTRLNNMLAVPLTRLGTQNLGKAYLCFDQVNKLHIRMHGIACPVAIYNQACCFSLAAGAFFRGLLDDPVGLPPCSLMGGPRIAGELAEARLVYAIATLHKAVEVGYADVAKLLVDEDLQIVRDRLPEDFQKLIQRMHMRCATGGA